MADQFHYVLDPMSRISIAEIPSIFIGRFLNIYFLAKTKILLKSRFFWLRSTGSSYVGTIVHSVIGDFFVFLGVVSFSSIASIILLNSLSNILTITFLSWIPVLVVYFIKNTCGIDEFNYKEKFNPFTL